MTKNEQQQVDLASQLAANGYRDQALRALSFVHRSTRRSATQAAALALVIELQLADRATMFNGCLAHVDDVPAVRS